MTELKDLDTSGSAAVVTGAASGIGRAIALQLADRGLDVAIADIDVDGLKTVAEEIEARGQSALQGHVNVADYASVEAFAESVFQWADRVSLVFANAGIHGLTSDMDPDLAVWERVVAVNLMGPVHMGKAFLPRLRAAGRPAQFAITGSQASYIAAPGMAPYIATKHGVWGLADCMRQTLRNEASQVGISLIAPGRAESGITRVQLEAARARGGDAAAEAYQALLTTPEKVAEVAIRETVKRAFWIIPTHQSADALFQSRVDEIFAAGPAGFIVPD